MKRKYNRKHNDVLRSVQSRKTSFVDRRMAETATPVATQITCLDLQHSLGNRATERLLHEVNPHALQIRPLVHIFRQAAEKENSASASALDPARLVLEGELPGHAAKGKAQTASRTTDAPVPREPATANTGVSVALSLLAPVEDRTKTAAQIAADHHQPGTAGWTTPHYQIAVSDVQPFHIDVDVILGFNIELASEFKGAALQVLRAHEQGHVNIGADKAQQHLVRDLKGYLESLPGFTDAGLIQQGFRNAADLFNAEEGKASRTYDAIDYPRMQQAYRGARMPLADLERTAASVAATAAALRSFLVLKPPLGRERLQAYSQAVIDACDTLSEDEKAMLQYNPEFKTLVDQVATIIGLWSVWLDKAAEPDASTSDKLDVLTVVLESFDWQPPV